MIGANTSTAMTLRQAIIECSRCPRLRAHCQEIATTKRRAYLDRTYWGRPVPTFGVRNPELLVVGLAPGAHGANRTGRVFTGDSSGDWLYRALYEHGFANQPESSDARDGLKLLRTAVNCVVRCAPPQNRPARDEIENCRAWLEEELAAYRRLKIVVVLGRTMVSRRLLESASPETLHEGLYHQVPAVDQHEQEDLERQ